ncbi:radical SAM protein [Candidatus Chloroploca sp. M-50]|uniref:Radical SAM protein n=1 Tax=Candidatus Chloroploca mongolica TaxID=2528176 RepID=A0ABS4DEV3_9CHLR|nr:radical SAM protein [Candidatus Chloroploca mongolica]MBP1467955.1 radical SAM protein [Candidatus Chloroploca mongolica]
MDELHVVCPVILYAHDDYHSSTADCGGGDCACSLPLLNPIEPYAVTSLALDSLKRSPGSQELRLDAQHQVLFGPFHRPVVINEPTGTILRAFTQTSNRESIFQAYMAQRDNAYLQPTVQALYAHRVLVPADVQPTLLPTAQTLSVWMHVTDRCNLRCSYCYLPHLRQDMSVEVGRAAIDAAFRSAVNHGYRELKLKYAGGEPLLCFERVIELHRYACEQGATHQIAVDGVVLSNGTLLTREQARILHEHNLRLMISLDGLGEIHNAQRPYASSRGTFDDVARGIEIARASGITPDISITATGKSATHLPQVVAWVLERALPFSLNFYRENELSATFQDLRLEEETIINGMLAAYAVIEQHLPARSVLGSLVDRANLAGAHLKTCGVGDHYLVFDYKGRVAKCQMHLHKPVTTVEASDPLSLIRADQIGLQNLSVEDKEGCKGCEWKYWCAGGCSLVTFRATGRYDLNSPNCNIYKALYPKAMRLEGLRILRYGLSVDLLA